VIEAWLDDFVPEVLRVTGAPGVSLAVALGGEPVCVRAWGRHDVADGRPLTPDSIFPAGSMTKLYTAIAVLQLVEHEVIGLHDPVRAHLPGVPCVNPLGGREITVHDLLTFRSGLAVDTTACSLGPPPPLGEHVAASLAARHGHEYAGAVPRWSSRVGERYHYANLAIATLGLLVERTNPEGLSLADYVGRHVIAPLGMRRTWLDDWTRPEPHPDRATGYACFGSLRLPTPELRSADFPANGLHTVPADHLRLLLALLGEGAFDGARILAPATVRLMLTPQVRMDEGDGLWPGTDWWTGLVAIMTRLGRRDMHFGHPGSHMWGWWHVSRAYPAFDLALVVCSNAWDMMRWHNPANLDVTALVADGIAEFVAGEPRPRSEPRSWAHRRSLAAGLLLAERTRGGLGVAEELAGELIDRLAEAGGAARGFDADGLRAGLRAGATGSIDAARAAALPREAGLEPAELPLLWRSLGEAYGTPLPLWFWAGADPATAAWS
jgi:CubicO group peptidase (beta-lactamase class C family)